MATITALRPRFPGVEDDIPEFGMGDRIRKARRFRGRAITQAQVAEAIALAGWRVSAQAVGNWEAGANDVEEDRRELVAVAVALVTGISREWILTGRRATPTRPDDAGCTRRDSNPQPSDPEYVANLAGQHRHLRAVA